MNDIEILNCNILIMGAGKLGVALFLSLKESGFNRLTIWNRFCDHSKKRLKPDVNNNVIYGAFPIENVVNSDIIFLTVSDGSISKVVEEFTESKLGVEFYNKKIAPSILHCSGSLNSDILRPLARLGFSIGSFHPLQSYSLETNNGFYNTYISLEGEEAAIQKASLVAKKLNAITFTLPSDRKVIYHASAVVASNLFVALLSLSKNLMSFATNQKLRDEDIINMLYPLVQGTLNNVKEQGITKALTGPISRGDLAIIEDHFKKIDDLKIPFLKEIYTFLSKEALNISASQGLDKDKINTIKNFLNSQ